MTRILHLMAGADKGGAEGFFARLLPALAEAGLDQAAAIRAEPNRLKALQDAGIRTRIFRFGGWWDFKTRFGVSRMAAQEQPDIVLAWMNRAAAVMPKGPWVSMARLGGYYDLKYYRRCNHLIGNTPDICRYLTGKGIAPERVHLLPNFIDAAPAPPVPRAELQTPEGVTAILCLGRLHRNKGFDTAIQAVAALPDAHLWIAGEGPEEAALKALAAELGITDRVHFLGWRRDIPALLAAADIFLCSSRHEPLGNIVLEAWAHGCPIVAAASQGPSQLIADGESGLMVPIDDAPAMADRLGRLIADPGLRARLAAAGRSAYARDYTKERVVAQCLELFERVLR